VPEIVESELNAIQAKSEHPVVISGEDYEIFMVRELEKREYTVHYKLIPTGQSFN
jgi:hypothetical protein